MSDYVRLNTWTIREVSDYAELHGWDGNPDARPTFNQVCAKTREWNQDEADFFYFQLLDLPESSPLERRRGSYVPSVHKPLD
jgi:hypothetical protein